MGLLIGVLAGCGSERGGATEWEASIDTIGDTVIVRTERGSVAAPGHRHGGQRLAFILLDPTTSVTEWRYGTVRYSSKGEPGDTSAAPTWDHQAERLVASQSDGESMAQRQDSTNRSDSPTLNTATWPSSGIPSSGNSARTV